jgi:hypothetical protein
MNCSAVVTKERGRLSNPAGKVNIALYIFLGIIDVVNTIK